MKQFLNILVGILGTIGFISAGISILVWDIGKLKLARDSRDWPQVPGVVTQSGMQNNRKGETFLIIYDYEVAAKPYTSRQISFDIFDKPGGRGRPQSILKRYPVGQTVTVYYDLNNPAVAILEPQEYSPFLMPAFWGILFTFFGLLLGWSTARVIANGTLDQRSPETIATPKNRFLATAFSSILFYAMILVFSFESRSRELFELAFGQRPLGIPNVVFPLVLFTVVYLPTPWIFWHVYGLLLQAKQDARDGQWIDLRYFLTAGWSYPDLKWSPFICLGGALYYLVIFAAWITYAVVLGI